jgi:hypothetical protein
MELWQIIACMVLIRMLQHSPDLRISKPYIFEVRAPMLVFGNTDIDVTLKYFFDASDELLLNTMAFTYQLDLTMG